MYSFAILVNYSAVSAATRGPGGACDKPLHRNELGVIVGGGNRSKWVLACELLPSEQPKRMLDVKGSDRMPSRISRCAVIEVPELSPGVPDLMAAPRDVLPWADPYIAALLTNRRLRAALDDSLQFLETEQEADWRVAREEWGEG